MSREHDRHIEEMLRKWKCPENIKKMSRKCWESVGKCQGSVEEVLRKCKECVGIDK